MKNDNELLAAMPVRKAFFRLALPAVAAQLINILYNLVDKMFIGHIPGVGKQALAGVGVTAPVILAISAFAALVSMGGAPKASIFMGKGDNEQAEKVMGSCAWMLIVLSVVLTAFMLIFGKMILQLFGASDNTILYATDYMNIYCVGTLFTQLTLGLNAFITAQGKTLISMCNVAVGAVTNIVLDAILINGFGMGVKGAAFATVLSQVMVTLIFIYVFYKMGYRINRKSFKYLEKNSAKEIIKWGTPSATQNCLFSFFAMLIGRIIAEWGATPIAVQKVGSQIESISWMSADGFASALSTFTWMTADGFSAALTAFVGQNYGAGQYERVKEGYKKTLMLSSILGIFATGLLIFGGEWLFSLFINEPEVIKQGADYLRILGYSQVFMCLEITTTGAFFGVGKTMIPSVISTIFTGLRVPAALILASSLALGVDGVWWSISLSSVVKGILLVIAFYFMVLKSFKKLNSECSCVNSIS